MMETTKQRSLLRINKTEVTKIEDLVTSEFPLTLIVNNRELVTLLCTPVDLKYLAVGFLESEGFLQRKDDIKSLLVDARRGIIRVETVRETDDIEQGVFKRFITTGCGRGTSFYSAADAQEQRSVESDLKIAPNEVFPLVREFLLRSQLYRMTGGVHSAALCEPGGIQIFTEDLGRHNAIDKIFGQCLLEAIPTENRIILTTGRITSEIVSKIARRQIPFLISKAAPTDLGVQVADELGITLIGFVRGTKMNVYTHDWRII